MRCKMARDLFSKAKHRLQQHECNLMSFLVNVLFCLLCLSGLTSFVLIIRKLGNEKNIVRTEKIVVNTDGMKIVFEVQKYTNLVSAPCDNFYKFVCDEFLDSTTRNDYDQAIYSQLENVMNAPKDPTEPKYVQNVKSTYQFCLAKRGMKSKECVEFVREKLTLATNFLYANKIYQKKDTTNLILIVSDITRLLIDSFKKAGWLKEKIVEEYVNYVGNNIIYLCSGDMEDFFDEKTIENEDAILVEDKDSIEKYAEQLKTFKFVRSPSDKGDISSVWRFVVNSATNTTISHYAYGDKVYLNIPRGTLESFHDKSFPEHLNYGILGTEIAQEIFKILLEAIHVVEERDVLYPQVDKKIYPTYLCVNNQLKTFLGLEVGPQVEDIPFMDVYVERSYGLKIAYLAYINWMAKNRAQLINFPHVNEQLFWITAARRSCIKDQNDDSGPLDKALHALMKKLIEFEITGLLSNLAEFSKDFRCLIGSNMNPANKCFI